MLNHSGIMANHMRAQGAQFINAYTGKIMKKYTILQAKQLHAAAKIKLDMVCPKPSISIGVQSSNPMKITFHDDNSCSRLDLNGGR